MNKVSLVLSSLALIVSILAYVEASDASATDNPTTTPAPGRANLVPGSDLYILSSRISNLEYEMWRIWDCFHTPYGPKTGLGSYMMGVDCSVYERP